MNNEDLDYMFDLLEGINQRLIRTESKLSALMNTLKLSQKGDLIDTANSGYSQNAGSRPTGIAQGRPNQRRLSA